MCTKAIKSIHAKFKSFIDTDVPWWLLICLSMEMVCPRVCGPQNLKIKLRKCTRNIFAAKQNLLIWKLKYTFEEFISLAKLQI